MIIRATYGTVDQCKVPKEIEFRKELPTTLVGKVLKRPLREEEKKKAGKT